MANVVTIDFETGDLSQWTSTTNASVITSPVNSGTYAGKITRVASAGNFLKNFAGSATNWYRFYMRNQSWTGEVGVCNIMDGSSLLKFALHLLGPGQLKAYDSAGGPLGTGTTLLDTDTWYRIELQVGTGASGPWQVKINGTLEIGGTGNLLGTNNAQINLGGASSYTSVTYFDDVAIDNAAYPGPISTAVGPPASDSKLFGLQNAAAVTPSDSVDLHNQARALYVGSGGNLVVVLPSGQQVTLLNVQGGAQIPLEVNRVMATGTTVGNILALW
jgi:hypothetical protein